VSDPEAILQLARLAGRAEFARRLGVEGAEMPLALDETTAARAQALVDERFDVILQGLIAEAMACDDVQDADSACAYLEDRLRVLGDLFNPAQRQHLRGEFARVAGTWS